MFFLLFLACAAAPPVSGSGHAVRLTHRQWEHTVVDLLGLTAPTGLSGDLVPDPARSTFDTDAAELSVSPVLRLQYEAAAEALALRVVSEPPLYATVAPSGRYPSRGAYTLAERDAWVAEFGGRAYRRPLDPTERLQLGALFTEGSALFASGEPFADGVRAVVTALLQSPGFLYRTEGVYGQAEPGALSPEELAVRLSYALWGTLPDAALFDAAEAGFGPEAQRAEAERLLDAPAGHAMVADLHRQLLHVDQYAQVWRPDEEVRGIGTYAASAPAAMQAELYAYVDDVVYPAGTVRELLTRSETFANSDLADIYGIEGIEGDTLVPVSLDPAERAGLLTLSGFLAWQAKDSEPNLIERGAFLNDALLCAEVPPPPAGAAPLPEATEGTSLRARIEAHTAGCGGACHTELINPIGFALGPYDEAGRYVPFEGDEPIDATGTYTFTEGPTDFDGAVDLAQVMAESEQVHRCYVGHLAGYLHGAPVSALDEAMLEALTEASLGDASIRSLILDIVTDPSFREVRPD